MADAVEHLVLVLLTTPALLDGASLGTLSGLLFGSVGAGYASPKLFALADCILPRVVDVLSAPVDAKSTSQVRGPGGVPAALCCITCCAAASVCMPLRCRVSAQVSRAYHSWQRSLPPAPCAPRCPS